MSAFSFHRHNDRTRNFRCVTFKRRGSGVPEAPQVRTREAHGGASKFGPRVCLPWRGGRGPGTGFDVTSRDFIIRCHLVPDRLAGCASPWGSGAGRAGGALVWGLCPGWARPLLPRAHAFGGQEVGKRPLLTCSFKVSSVACPRALTQVTETRTSKCACAGSALSQRRLRFRKPFRDSGSPIPPTLHAAGPGTNTQPQGDQSGSGEETNTGKPFPWRLTAPAPAGATSGVASSPGVNWSRLGPHRARRTWAPHTCCGLLGPAHLLRAPEAVGF